MTESNSSSDKVAIATAWFQGKRSQYEELARSVEGTLRTVLAAEGIPLHSIISRAKEVDKYSSKAAKDKYDDPINQIKDMAGVRVITYVDSDAMRAANLIEKYFHVIPEHSGDASLRLGTNQVGYRSIHFVCTLTEDRVSLPDFSHLKDLEVEIQVRTILQHAWAEVEHDRNYKFAGELPESLQRRFMILSGVLELADREFDSIASAIDSYVIEVGARTEAGDLDVELDTPALREYLMIRLSNLVEAGLVQPHFSGSEVLALEELRLFGIEKLSQLAEILPADIEEEAALEQPSNFLGVLRTAMMLKNANRYFAVAWRNEWGGFVNRSYDYLKARGVDVDALAEEYDLYTPNHQRLRKKSGQGKPQSL